MRLWLGLLAVSNIALGGWNTSEDASIWENYVEDSNYHEFISSESGKLILKNFGIFKENRKL